MHPVTSTAASLIAAGVVLASNAAEPDKVSEFDGMPQIRIPAGAFVMGADDPDALGRTAEFPPHRVELDDYWLDQHEVTNAQFAAFLNEATKGNRELIYRLCDLGDPACRIAFDPESGTCVVERGFEEHPVCAVSWDGAWQYARHVRRRLPTEAEWEKAARGTDRRRYPWGDEWDPSRTNTREAGPGRTAPVGATTGDRSAYGVWDLAGNVREWVQDGWDETFYQVSPVQNPVCEATRGRFVVRGGAWCLTEWDARTTSRQFLIGSSTRRYMGFRCAETVPEPLPPPAKVSDDVLFYAPMDGNVHAAAASGRRRALMAPKTLPFSDGRRGQAVVLGDDGDARRWVDYDTAGNIRLEQGTISFWIQPRGWGGTDEGFRYFFMIRDTELCKFYVYRFVRDKLTVLAGNGIEGQWGALSSSTADWADGDWRHLAVTWENRTVALYVDGKPIARTVVPPDRWFRGLPTHFSLGQSQNWSPKAKKAATAFDEFVIFNRALAPDEITREYQRTALP